MKWASEICSGAHSSALFRCCGSGALFLVLQHQICAVVATQFRSKLSSRQLPADRGHARHTGAATCCHLQWLHLVRKRNRCRPGPGWSISRVWSEATLAFHSRVNFVCFLCFCCCLLTLLLPLRIPLTVLFLDCSFFFICRVLQIAGPSHPLCLTSVAAAGNSAQRGRKVRKSALQEC